MNHFYQNIKGWASEEEQGLLLKTILPLLPKDKLTIAEIGVFRGRGTALWNVELINLGIEYKYYAIDNFLGFAEWEKSGDDFYTETINNLNQIIDNISLIKNNSVPESKNYADKSFDIIYIDAEHGEEDVKNDISAWLPKIKLGGIICGDDYTESWVGVINAVSSKFDKVNILGNQQWWVQI